MKAQTSRSRPLVRAIWPGSPQWSAFLHLYASYLQQHWPQCFAETAIEHHHALLQARWEQGGRGLFLLQDGAWPAGLANAWLDRQGDAVTLQVAEFYVSAEWQRRGWGSLLWRTVLGWGQQHGATHIGLEVDADKPVANAFWLAQGLAPLATEGNRIYYGSALHLHNGGPR